MPQQVSSLTMAALLGMGASEQDAQRAFDLLSEDHVPVPLSAPEVRLTLLEALTKARSERLAEIA